MPAKKPTGAARAKGKSTGQKTATKPSSKAPPKAEATAARGTSAEEGRPRARESVGRERVMEAALQMFLHRGYGGTSMKSLAQELGVSAPALYWYFPSKEDLYVEVFETSMTDFVKHVEQSITEDHPVLKLGQMVRAHVSWQLQRSEAARAFDQTMASRARTDEIPTERLQNIHRMEQEYGRLFRRVLTEGKEQGVMVLDDVKTTSFAILTLCEYVHTWYRPDGELSVTAVANRYETMVRRMVGAVAP
jgi:AcrR family transcriptional regulator